MRDLELRVVEHLRRLHHISLNHLFCRGSDRFLDVYRVPKPVLQQQLVRIRQRVSALPEVLDPLVLFTISQFMRRSHSYSDIALHHYLIADRPDDIP